MLSKRRIVSASFLTLFMANIIRLFASELTVIQTLFDFPVYFKFFHRVICAGQPGRDYSRLYQHDQLSDSGSAKQNEPYSQPVCGHYLVDLAFSRRHDSTTFWYIN